MKIAPIRSRLGVYIGAQVRYDGSTNQSKGKIMALKLTHLKFPAVGSEPHTMLEAAIAVGAGCKVATQGNWFTRATYITLSAHETNDVAMTFLGAVYDELVRIGRV